MANDFTEDAVARCYSTWGSSYYDDYYGPAATYPPVHRDLILRILDERRIVTLLDAGCGPASMLRHLDPANVDFCGFDLTPEMVSEAQRVLGERQVSPDRIWQGSILDPAAFHRPDASPAHYDGVICVGVMPHIPEPEDGAVLQNIYRVLKPGGTAIIEARNVLFSLFSLNRYSYGFFRDTLIGAEAIRRRHPDATVTIDQALERLQEHFSMDMPPLRRGKAGEPGYDEVLSRSHNPLVFREQMSDVGFSDVRCLFYHYHAVPPIVASDVKDVALRESIAMENPADWRGYFMASAFLCVATK